MVHIVVTYKVSVSCGLGGRDEEIMAVVGQDFVDTGFWLKDLRRELFFVFPDIWSGIAAAELVMSNVKDVDVYVSAEAA